MLGLAIAYVHAKFDHSNFSQSEDMVYGTIVKK